MALNTEVLDKWISDLNNFKVKAQKELIEYVKEMGGKIEIPYEVNDYCSTQINYDGGRHPEYASGFADVEMLEYYEKNNSLYAVIDKGGERGVQNVEYCYLDDVLSLIEMVLTVQEHFSNVENDLDITK
jgi:hypothetical protein